MTSSIRRAELKAFLRAHRAAMTPEDAGIARGKRRLTQGLRREELALLAGIGLTWYTWLEQGREINVSADTLGRVARALKLSTPNEAYLFTLAGLPAPRIWRPANTKPLPTLQRVLDGFTSGPAVIFDPAFSVLAFNRLWDLIYRFNDYRGPFATNHIYRMFVDPARRRLYSDYEAVGRNMVGLLRAHYADHLGDPQFEQLVDALLIASPEFAGVWRGHQTQSLETFNLRLHHHELGDLALYAARFPVEDIPGALMFFGPPADAETAAILAKAYRSLRTKRSALSDAV